jgi:hypothetical protein
MAYAITNPPHVLVPSLGGKGPQVWGYESADPRATVNGADYFSNGDELGMRVGDLVIVYDTVTPLTSVHFVAAVTAGGAADVNDIPLV